VRGRCLLTPAAAGRAANETGSLDDADSRILKSAAPTPEYRSVVGDQVAEDLGTGRFSANRR
jgi:hypothetical protein